MGVKEASAKYQIAGDPVDAAEENMLPGFKRTEVGVFPEDWGLLPLGQFLTFKNGLNKGKEYFGKGTPIVNYMDVYRLASLRAADLLGRVEVNQRELDSFGVRKGDVFFTRTSETLDEIGIASVLEEDSPRTVFSGFLLRGRAQDDRLIDEFKRYCFGSASVRNQITSTGTYTTRALTNGAALSRVLLPFPCRKIEQQAIAGALSDTDALIESLQQLIAKKRALKRGAMQALLTGRQRLPGFSGEWKTRRLDQLFRFGGGFSASRAQLGQEGCFYLHYGDIHGSSSSCVDVRSDAGRIPKIAIALARISRDSMLDDGDVVFVDASEDEEGVSKHVVVSNPCGVPFIAGLHTIVAKGVSADLVHAYRRYCFCTEEVKQQFRFFAVGTKVQGVSKGNIGKIELRFPRKEEQTAIAIVLSDMDAEIDALEARLAKTRDLKAGMMQALLTGRIRLPLDEVA